MKRFSINDQGVGVYTLVEGSKLPDGTPVAPTTFSLDMNTVFGYAGLSDLAKRAVAFATGHVLRNATAGKMDDKAKAEGYKEAKDAIEARIKALAEGKWSERRDTGEAGESARSLLSQALAVVMGVTADEAADFIANEVRSALEEKGIDPDTDNDDLSAEQKSTKRKVAAAVRKSIGDDPAVSVELQKIKLANAQAALAEKTKEAEGKQSTFAKKE